VISADGIVAANISALVAGGTTPSVVPVTRARTLRIA
jgi:hypothetical protein